MNKIQWSLAIAITGFIGLVQAVTLPGPVVSSDWLAANQSEVQVLEVRGDVASYTRAPEFEVDKKTGKKFLVEVGGHIPDSTLLDFKKVRVDRVIDGKKVKYLIPEKADFEKIIQSAGINSDKPIVLVPVALDISDVDEALRAYWQFKVYGEDNIAVLDGGMAGWLAEGRDFSVAPSVKTAGTWVGKAERKELIANSEQVALASKTGKSTLIDARQPVQYFGLNKRDYIRPDSHNSRIATPKHGLHRLATRPSWSKVKCIRRSQR